MTAVRLWHLRMLRTSPFRCLIALFLAAWMPFCCCSLNSLLSVCRACEATEDGNAVGVCHGHGSSDRHTAGSQHHDEDSAPTQPDQPKRDDGPCTCDKSKQTTVGVEKNTSELPAPVVAYVLPEWESSWLPHGDPLARRCDNWALRKPATSLLRQHCALIV